MCSNEVLFNLHLLTTFITRSPLHCAFLSSSLPGPCSVHSNPGASLGEDTKGCHALPYSFPGSLHSLGFALSPASGQTIDFHN